MNDARPSEPLRWFKSSRSASNGACVEIAKTDSGVAVRDSKNPNGPVLRFSRGAWQGFVAEVRANSFDLPTDS